MEKIYFIFFESQSRKYNLRPIPIATVRCQAYTLLILQFILSDFYRYVKTVRNDKPVVWIHNWPSVKDFWFLTRNQ